MTYCVDVIEFKKAMISKGFMTNDSLGNACNVSRNTIGDILSGKTRPSSTVIEKIATELELSGEDIGRIFFSRKLA